MKFTRYLLLALVVVSVFSFSAYGQKTSKRTTKASSTKAAALPPLDVRAARVKVDNQKTNLSLFLERLGPVAEAIEALDAEAKANKKVKQESLDKNAADKQKVIAAIRGLREGMVKLESEFRVKPVLKKYLPTIQGISELAGQAETSAVGGRFVAAATQLRSVEQKLNDTLAAMPNAEL